MKDPTAATPIGVIPEDEEEQYHDAQETLEEEAPVEGTVADLSDLSSRQRESLVSWDDDTKTYEARVMPGKTRAQARAAARGQNDKTTGVTPKSISSMIVGKYDDSLMDIEDESESSDAKQDAEQYPPGPTPVSRLSWDDIDDNISHSDNVIDAGSGKTSKRAITNRPWSRKRNKLEDSPYENQFNIGTEISACSGEDTLAGKGDLCREMIIGISQASESDSGVDKQSRTTNAVNSPLNQKRKELEESPPQNPAVDNSKGYVLKLGVSDVLMGLGLGKNGHTGNIQYRQLIAHRHEEYQATNQYLIKDRIAREIMNTVLTKFKGRFLTKAVQDTVEARRLGIPQGIDAWIVADASTVMRKVKQALKGKRQIATAVNDNIILNITIPPRQEGETSRQMAIDESKPSKTTNVVNSPLNQKRKQLEESPPQIPAGKKAVDNSKGYVLKLGVSDVLMGSGGDKYKHAGNIHYRQLVAARKQEYQTTENHATKNKIAREILNKVKGRFLKKADDDIFEAERLGISQGIAAWIIIADDATIMTKTKHALKEKRKYVTVGNDNINLNKTIPARQEGETSRPMSNAESPTKDSSSADASLNSQDKGEPPKWEGQETRLHGLQVYKDRLGAPPPIQPPPVTPIRPSPSIQLNPPPMVPPHSPLMAPPLVLPYSPPAPVTNVPKTAPVPEHNVVAEQPAVTEKCNRATHEKWGAFYKEATKTLWELGTGIAPPPSKRRRTALSISATTTEAPAISTRPDQSVPNNQKGNKIGEDPENRQMLPSDTPGAILSPGGEQETRDQTTIGEVPKRGSSEEENFLTGITNPRDTDILFGCGGPGYRHPGNDTYQNLVNMNKDLYRASSETDKLKISQSIVAALREEENSRFLEEDYANGGWFDIGNKRAMEKISKDLGHGGQPGHGQLELEQEEGTSGQATIDGEALKRGSREEEYALAGITIPRDTDILFGSGGSVFEHPGNDTCQQLVEMNLGLYGTSSETKKLEISQSIVAVLREENRRFLAEDSAKKGYWFDIGDEMAIRKITQGLECGPQPKLEQGMVEMGGWASAISSFKEQLLGANGRDAQNTVDGSSDDDSVEKGFYPSGKSQNRDAKSVEEGEHHHPQQQQHYPFDMMMDTEEARMEAAAVGEMLDSESLHELLLPIGFLPSPNTVIVGRGKKVAQHAGNVRLRALVKKELIEYSAATTKAHKSSILNCVLTEIRNKSHCAFVKQNLRTGQWYCVEERAQRIATAQAFRDALKNNYKSSRAFKKSQREEQKMKNGKGDGNEKTNEKSAERNRELESATTCIANQYAQLSRASSQENNWKTQRQPTTVGLPTRPGLQEMITHPRDTDVLCGLGTGALRHPGNMTYRHLVNFNKGLYTTCFKKEKPNISRGIVAAIRKQNGRFLEKDAATDSWFDIGDKKALEKTSQALREGQAHLRQAIVKLGGTAEIPVQTMCMNGTCTQPPPQHFRPNDVLFGCGHTRYNHSGNKRFRRILSQSFDKYCAAPSQYKKSVVVTRLVSMVQNSGGRFLKQKKGAEDQWYELLPIEACAKVHQALEYAIRRTSNGSQANDCKTTTTHNGGTS